MTHDTAKNKAEGAFSEPITAEIIDFAGTDSLHVKLKDGTLLPTPISNRKMRFMMRVHGQAREASEVWALLEQPVFNQALDAAVKGYRVIPELPLGATEIERRKQLSDGKGWVREREPLVPGKANRAIPAHPPAAADRIWRSYGGWPSRAESVVFTDDDMEAMLREAMHCSQAGGNLGLVLGQPLSGGSILIAVDYDRKIEGEDQLYSDLNRILAGAPLKFGSKGGTWFCRMLPGEAAKLSKVYALPGAVPKIEVEILGAGRKTTIPPSQHYKGGQYRWIRPLVPVLELPLVTADDLETWILAAGFVPKGSLVGAGSNASDLEVEDLVAGWDSLTAEHIDHARESLLEVEGAVGVWQNGIGHVDGSGWRARVCSFAIEAGLNAAQFVAVIMAEVESKSVTGGHAQGDKNRSPSDMRRQLGRVWMRFCCHSDGPGGGFGAIEDDHDHNDDDDDGDAGLAVDAAPAVAIAPDEKGRDRLAGGRGHIVMPRFNTERDGAGPSSEWIAGLFGDVDLKVAGAAVDPVFRNAADEVVAVVYDAGLGRHKPVAVEGADLDALVAQRARVRKKGKDGKVGYVAPSGVELLATTVARGGMKTLSGIRGGNIIKPDGSVLGAREGYDAMLGVFLSRPDGLDTPAIPTDPVEAKRQAVAAVTRLMGVARRVNFCSPADRHCFLSFLLTGCIAEHLPTRPGWALSSTAAGAGKNYAAQIGALLATGRTAPVINDMKDRGGEELGKRLDAELLRGSAFIVLDEVRELGGPQIDSILTSPVIPLRRMGRSETTEVRNGFMLVATKKNIDIRSDTSTRVVLINIDKAHPDAEDYDAQADLVTHWRDYRRDVAVTLRAAHIHAPAYSPVRGMPRFDHWARAVCRAVQWLTGYDVGERMAELSEGDEVKPHIDMLSAALFTLFGEEKVRAGQIIDEVVTGFDDDHPDAKARSAARKSLTEFFGLALGTAKPSPKSLTRWMRENRVGNIYKIVSGMAHNQAAFAVEKMPIE